MAKVLDEGLYVAVDPVANNNKYWKYQRFDQPITETNRKGQTQTGDLRTEWGRVGAEKPESKLEMYSETTLAKKIREKENKKPPEPPYRKVAVVGSATTAAPATSGKSVAKEEVKKLAIQEIANGCPVLSALVKKLAEANRHELREATGNKIDIDLETGIVRTAVGVVTLESVKEARKILDKLEPFVKNHDTENKRYTDLLAEYLYLVPQSVGTMKGGWYRTWLNLDKQSSLLDQLEASIEVAEQRMQDAANGANGEPKAKRSLFGVKMKLVDDKKVIDRITKFYYDNVNRSHSCSHLKPVRVYEVEIPHMKAAFEADGAKVGNVRQLWHGTRMFNVLSILKRGFVLPTQLSSVQTTGAMFGNGCYFSDQSTKSLNYAYGYWSGARERNCFMFLVDVAMGREYVPSGPCNGNKPGYDSCYAKAHRSGVINNEMIVYRTSQANIRYLVEFE